MQHPQYILPQLPERCDCRACIEQRGDTVGGLQRLLCEMILCPKCGNKRCPHAADHRNNCTGSNATSQNGSVARSRSERKPMSENKPGPLQAAMQEAFDGIKCWAVHIEGPDDIIPAPSKHVAQFAADVTNRWLCESPGEDFPAARAVVVEWTHGYEAWKVGSEQFAAEWSGRWIKHQDVAARAVGTPNLGDAAPQALSISADISSLANAPDGLQPVVCWRVTYRQIGVEWYISHDFYKLVDAQEAAKRKQAEGATDVKVLRQVTYSFEE